MSAPQHTPGPLYVEDKLNSMFYLQVRTSDGQIVARVMGALTDRGNFPNYATATANANLIAAAPGALEALKKASMAVCYMRDQFLVSSGPVNMKQLDELQNAIDAPIAKAEGRS